MGDYKTTIKVSDKNILASDNWKPLKNVMIRKCANCNSMNTVCIFSEGAGCIIGAYFEDEFYCRDCKHYTLYIFEYDS